MVWRRLLVRSDSTIADLHYTIQLGPATVAVGFCADDVPAWLARFGGLRSGRAGPRFNKIYHISLAYDPVGPINEAPSHTDR